MDHLPTCSKIYNTVKVPYLGEIYDNQGFFTFPERKGWAVEDILSGKYLEQTPTTFTAFLQSWLFFGSISEVLSCPLDANLFLCYDDDGTSIITTHCFNNLMQERREREKVMIFDDKLDWYSHSHDILSKATEVMNQISRKVASGVVNPLDPAIELSIWVMLSTLQYELAHMFYTVGKIPTRRIIDDGGPPLALPPLAPSLSCSL
ncbi:MAG: hypothetical protein M1834_006896 [Cirrosporium novae-zelandiae]|nr:MAG: hypothetical protein M1834_006896 [Cirrosporium novae-zelandiae]